MGRNEERAPRSAQESLNRAKAAAAELAGAGFTRVPKPVEPFRDSGVDELGLFDRIVTDPDLNAATRTLFRDGHYARAVEEAFKFLNNAVRGRARDGIRDGQALMMHVFDPDSPVLRINRLRTMSQKDEQMGYRFIFAGVMTGIRNPRAHEHALRDEAETAIEMLAMANHLMRAVRRSTRTRQPRATRAAH